MSSVDDDRDDGDDWDRSEELMWIVDVKFFMEGLILLASLTASLLHFQAAGGRFSSLTRFHVAHTTTITWFVAWELAEVIQDKAWPPCRSHLWAFQESVLDGLFVITWIMFADYWEKVLIPQGRRRRVRKTLFLLCYVLALTGDIILLPSVQCSDPNKHLAILSLASRVPFGVLLWLDASRLARACFRRVAEVSLMRASHDSLYAPQPFLRVLYKTWHLSSMSACFFLGIVCLIGAASTVSERNDVGQMAVNFFVTVRNIFSLIFPGFLMLRATWKRRYLSVTTGKPTSETDIERALSFNDTMISVESLADPLLHSTRGERWESADEEVGRLSLTAMYEEDDDFFDRAAQLPPLLRGSRGASGEPTMLRDLLASTAGLTSRLCFPAEGRPEGRHRSVVVTEALAPPPCVLPAARLFLEGVALPRLRRLQTFVAESLRRLQRRTRPTSLDWENLRGSIGTVFAVLLFVVL
jgi:hypothetical protein